MAKLIRSTSQQAPRPALRPVPCGLGMNALAQQRLERGARHLHTLGPRALAEFLAELGATIGGQPAILRLLAEFQNRLTPTMVRAAGGDRFPPRPLREASR